MKFEINKNLITLKCVLFLVFGALGCLHPFLPLHMNTIGLSRDESTKISAFAPLFALIGPLVAAPLADKFGGSFSSGSRHKTGRYLRVMICICLFFAAVFYWLLLTIPPVFRSPPNVTFMCDQNGGYILQDRCGPERTCYNWNGEHGSVLVKNCVFSCNATTLYKSDATTAAPEELSDSNESSTDEYYDATVYPEADLSAPHNYEETQSAVAGRNLGFFPHPHMCYNDMKGITVCEVYTEYSKIVDFGLSLKPSLVQNRNSSESNKEDICRYPFDNYFSCRITEETRNELISFDADCHPIVLCEVHDPYNNTDSLLRRSQCGYDNISFWLYIFIRCVADMFPAAAITLLATAVVIATRETSTGRGDIGKQLAAGALGFALFAPIVGGVCNGVFFDCMVCFTVLVVLAILILLFDNNMPLSPPEWWWHTRCGLLALPMSSVRKYGFEIVALGVVLLLLGIFWNAIDAFLPWHLVKLPEGTPFIIGLTITMGALPAVILFIYAEKIVDYCSHSNILILCFVVYIIHHVALICVKSACALLIFEVLEIFTLHLMWVTAILYLRHLVPRKYTSCGQALPVIAHFCLGRSIGSFLGSFAYSEYPGNFDQVHEKFAFAAAIISVIYFLSYHLYMKPKCAAAPQLPPYPAPSVVQSMNGNGSYTPLRVYHNGRAKKGQFRY